MIRGRLVTIEGVEGAGKSTQARLLGEALADAGVQVRVTREPGGTPGAEAIRGLLVQPGPELFSPLTEALLHYAARHEHLDRALRGTLAAGGWVICDRFADSTLAYQGFGQGLDRAVIGRLHALVLGAFAPDLAPGLAPHLTIILDLDASEGLARTRARASAADRYERMDRDFHRRVREGFLEIARREPDRCAVIDAAAPPDQVQRSVWTVVRDRLADALPGRTPGPAA